MCEGTSEDELAGGEGTPERGNVFAADDLSEGADGKEKAGRRGDPARAIINHIDDHFGSIRKTVGA
jgi:hypothetical protein